MPWRGAGHAVRRVRVDGVRRPAAAAVDAAARQQRRRRVHRPTGSATTPASSPSISASVATPPSVSPSWSLAAVGVVIGCLRRPALDVPLAAVMVLSALAVSTHFRMVDRYYFQVAPWVVYFGVVAVVLAAARSSRLGAWPGTRRGAARRVDHVAASCPFVVLCISHAAVLGGDIADARDFDGDGRTPDRSGPSRLTSPIYDAVTRQHRSRRRRRLLPGPHDDAAHRSTVVPDDLARRRAPARPTTSPSASGSTYSQPSPTVAEATRRRPGRGVGGPATGSCGA